jgi:TrkA domain protein
MGEHVKVQELPGIGTRYDLAGSRAPHRLSVVVHKDGTRDVYVFTDAGSEPRAVLELTETQARLVAAVLNGSYVTD